MKIQIRPMALEDVPQVHRLETRIFTDSWSREAFIREIEKNEFAYCCVLLSENTILGYAVAWHFSGELHINNIAVAPESRRKGLGKKLLEHLLKKFPECSIAYLEVRFSNEAAIRLYEQRRFKKIAIRKAYYPDGEDAIVMLRETK